MIVVELAGGRLRLADIRGKGGSASVAAYRQASLPVDFLPTQEETIVAWLKGLLKEAGLAKQDALILLGRGVVQLKSVRVPVVPEGELPTVVGFALDNVGQSASESVVDFQAGPILPINDTESELDVLTALVPVERLDLLKRVLSKCGLNPKRVTLRPYATHALLASTLDTAKTQGTIFVSDDGVEIALWTAGKLRLCRWISGTPGSTSPQRLANDVRRTLAAFHAEAGNDHVEQLFVIGESAPALAESLTEMLATSTTSPSVANVPSEQLSLVGGADLVAPTPIDFLKPKKAVVTSNLSRVRVLAGTLVAVLLAGAGYVAFTKETARRDSQIQSLQTEQTLISQQIRELQPTTDRHKVIKAWIESGDPLLDELQEVAAQLPDTSDLFLTGLEYNAGQNDQPGTIKLDGLSRDQSIVTRAQTLIAGKQSGRYDIVPRGLDPGADVGPFVWRFGLDLGFDPLSIAEYAQRASDRAKTLDALKPPPNMVRQEVSLERKPTTAASGKADRKEAKQAAKAEASATGSDLRRRKIEELRKLPPDQREAALAKEPKFLQKQLRQELKKEGL